MLAHEYFHEQAHIECRHELKRFLLLAISIAIVAGSLTAQTGIQIFLLLPLLFLYRFYCRRQEYQADFIAAQKCGKENAIESLTLLKMREKSMPAIANLFSLHPKTEKRISAIASRA